MVIIVTFCLVWQCSEEKNPSIIVLKGELHGRIIREWCIGSPYPTSSINGTLTAFPKCKYHVWHPFCNRAVGGRGLFTQNRFCKAALLAKGIPNVFILLVYMSTPQVLGVFVNKLFHDYPHIIHDDFAQ